MHDTDLLMLFVYESLRKDMRKNLGMTDLSGSSVFQAKTPAEIRETSLVLHENMTPYQYKWGAQLNSFLKRYTFRKDLLSPKQREDITNAKFIKLQETLAISYWRPRTLRCHQVLRLARKIATGILGKITIQDSSNEGRFGTKATVGCPASVGYIDTKLCHKPITGSAAHVEWFKQNILTNDPLLADIVATNKSGYAIIHHLAQVNVPKNYKIDRGINPNTLIGSLYTDTIGKLIVAALKEEGLDIRKLQNVHGKLAKRASILNRSRNDYIKLVTADLSDASHGFLSNILNALLPRKWYNAVMKGVIRKVEVDGRVYRLESIMTMGIGFTFPMQTLLFYCLLKSISELTNITGTISVYGDDLIYPQKLHPYVVGIFQDLGFKLNLDKTFVNSSFKESCGSDYFRGVDVRPYSPEAEGASLGDRNHAAFCYQLINGLLSKWSYWEIETTINHLLWEIMFSMGTLFIVPHDSPEQSGIRENSVPAYVLGWYTVEKSIWDPDQQCYLHPHLLNIVPRHYVSNQSPYYWDWLRQNYTREFSWDSPLSLPDIIGKPVFSWKRLKAKKRSPTFRKSKVKKRATVASKQGELVTRYEVRRPALAR